MRAEAVLIGVVACLGCSAHQEPPRPAQSASACPQQEGVTLTLHGLAADAKGGAVVRVDGGPVYVDGLESWSALGLNRAPVRVTGILRTRKVLPDPVTDRGEIMQGAWGSQCVIEQARWLREP